VPNVVRHGVSDSQVKEASERVTTILNKLLGAGHLLRDTVEARVFFLCTRLQAQSPYLLASVYAAFANRILTGKEVVLTAQVSANTVALHLIAWASFMTYWASFHLSFAGWHSPLLDR
jgi:hypothetical protein